MEALVEAIKDKAGGLDFSGKPEKEIKAAARALGIDPFEHTPHTVELVTHTNKRDETNRFVKTSAYKVGVNSKGFAQTVQGLFLRVDCLDQVIEDLLEARRMLDAESVDLHDGEA